MRILLTVITCPKGDVDGNLARHLGLVAGAEPDVDLITGPPFRAWRR